MAQPTPMGRMPRAVHVSGPRAESFVGLRCIVGSLYDHIELTFGAEQNAKSQQGDQIMPLTVAQIRIVAGILAVIVLFIIIWRRKRKASE